MKRFFFLVNSRFPTEKAHGHQIMAMSQALAARVPNFTLIVPTRKNPLQQSPFAYYEVKKTFAIQKVRVIDWLHLRWFPKVLSFWIERISFIYAVRNRLDLCVNDVIYSRDLLTLPRKGRCLRIVEVHSLPASFIERRLLKKVDGIVTVTRALKENFMNMGIPAGVIHVAPDAATENAFCPVLERRDLIRAELGIKSQEHVLLYTGKFTTMGMSKGLDEATAAVQRLRAAGRAVTLLAVGGTADEVERYVKSSHGHAYFLQHVPQSRLKEYYAAADILIMPFPWRDHYAYAMSPLKLFEYLQTGKPIIASDLPSVREIVSDDEVVFCKPGSVESLTEAVQWLLNHPEEGAIKARKAKELSGIYTWEARAEGILQWISALRPPSTAP
jgi:glycosyltransferase involved in cell wall biosynthesis